MQTRRPSHQLLVAAVAAYLTLMLVGHVRAQPAPALSPQCSSVDFGSAQSLFECMGTIRHRNGTSKFANLDRRGCAATLQLFMREIGQIRAFRDTTQPIPSCEVVAKAAELMTGKSPYWASCTGYPAADSAEHMRTCVQAFAPTFYGPRFQVHIGTCEGFRRGYELALKASNNRHTQRLPEGYTAPSCDVVNAVIAELTGGQIQLTGCANYNLSNVREHLLACVGSSPRDFLQLRDCVSVRRLYEQRLRATHGGLPRDYTVLSCSDAQAVLDQAAAHKEEQEARRAARADAAERERQAAIGHERRRVEEAREKILAARKMRRSAAAPTCDPGPNRYPNHKYGAVLTAFATRCVRTLSPMEQLFAAGLGERLVQQCRLPAADRILIADFVSAAVYVGVGGREYRNPDLGEMIRDQAASQAAYMSGSLAFRVVFKDDCKQAASVARGLAQYLRQTASESRWVDGCELQYAGLYTRAQCECMANKIRAVDPGIHAKAFSRGAIQSLIRRNPLLALQMATQCGVGDY